MNALSWQGMVSRMVQIDNMEMPKNCFDCDLNYDYFRCAITRTNYYEDEQFNPSEERLSDCPLREAQSVVRCKDCKHSTEWYRDRRRCFLWCEDGIDVFEDGYCNYWDRKDGEQNDCVH